jgi:acetyltransferase-like isoleucine patch superfamily enzyme
MKIKQLLSKGSLYGHLAQMYWTAGSEITAWKMAFIGDLPGHIGVRVRGKLLPQYFKSCGVSPFIERRFRVINPALMTVGGHFYCNSDVYINASGGLQIGCNVLIGPGVKIWTVNHRTERIDTPIIEQGWDYGQVIIEDDVWIGAACIVLPGTLIGRGSVISAGSVLGKSVRPFSIVAGNPGRIIGYRVPKEEYFASEDLSPTNLNQAQKS